MTERTTQKRLDLLDLCRAFNIQVPGRLVGVKDTMCYEELACLEMELIQRLAVERGLPETISRYCEILTDKRVGWLLHHKDVLLAVSEQVNMSDVRRVFELVMNVYFPNSATGVDIVYEDALSLRWRSHAYCPKLCAYRKCAPSFPLSRLCDGLWGSTLFEHFAHALGCSHVRFRRTLYRPENTCCEEELWVRE